MSIPVICECGQLWGTYYMIGTPEDNQTLVRAVYSLQGEFVLLDKTLRVVFIPHCAKCGNSIYATYKR